VRAKKRGQLLDLVGYLAFTFLHITAGPENAIFKNVNKIKRLGCLRLITHPENTLQARIGVSLHGREKRALSHSAKSTKKRTC
jgi:hypothetical protein